MKKVSVVIITYRQEAYVAQAIQSILDQRTNFDVEIVIGDDCSPDRTGEIVREYAGRYPDRIRALNRKKNIGMMRNWVETQAACSGQYIAPLEGDDYWSDPEKLQRQADAMDAHPDWTACFHRFRYIYNDGREPTVDALDLPAVLGVGDLMASNPIQTGCLMFRRGVVPQFPPGFLQLGLGDWPTVILHADRGPIGFLDRIMTNYRVHTGGVWSLVSELSRSQKIADMFLCVLPAVKPSSRRLIRAQAARRLVQLSAQYQSAGDRKSARRVLWSAARQLADPLGFPYLAFGRRLVSVCLAGGPRH